MQCGTDVNDYSPFAMLVPLLLVGQCHNSRPQLNRLADVYKKNNAATSNLRFLCTTACVHTDSESNYALAPYAHKHVQTSKPKQHAQKKERAYVNSRAIDHFNSLGFIQQQKLPLRKLSLNGPDFRVTRTSGYIHTPEADQGHWHLTVSQDPNNILM